MRKETKTTELASTDRKIQDCKLLPFLIEFFFGVEVIFAIRLRATWRVAYKNSNGDIYSVYWQFSLKDPWLLPKYGPNFCSGPLYGWLFFYDKIQKMLSNSIAEMNLAK